MSKNSVIFCMFISICKVTLIKNDIHLRLFGKSDIAREYRSYICQNKQNIIIWQVVYFALLSLYRQGENSRNIKVHHPERDYPLLKTENREISQILHNMRKMEKKLDGKILYREY